MCDETSHNITTCVMKGKNLQPITLYPARLSFRFGERRSFPEKQKLKQLSTTKLAFPRNVKGASLSEKEKTTTRYMEITKGKISLVKSHMMSKTLNMQEGVKIQRSFSM